MTVHTNFHAKSGVCSSKNGWVIALGTKENISGSRRRWRRRSTLSSVDYTVQTLKFIVRKFVQYVLSIPAHSLTGNKTLTTNGDRVWVVWSSSWNMSLKNRLHYFGNFYLAITWSIQICIVGHFCLGLILYLSTTL